MAALFGGGRMGDIRSYTTHAHPCVRLSLPIQITIPTIFKCG
jgi:hypothetical protein